MSSSRGPQPGTVADRIRAFQGRQHYEAPPPSASIITPRSQTAPKKAAPPSNDSRQKETKFPHPITRNESVANKDVQTYEKQSFTSPRKKSHLEPIKNDQIPQKVSVFTLPSTSMERNPEEQKTAQKLGQPPSRRVSRKHQSMENLVGESSELAGARSRLRSIMDDNEEKSIPPRSRAYTLAELNHMLDDAIEGGVEFDDVLSGSTTGEATSRTIPDQHQAPVSVPQRQSLSRERAPRASIDSIRPRSSDSSDQGIYDDEKNALYWPHIITKTPTKRPHTSHSTRPISIARAPPKPTIEPVQPKPMQSRTQFSPVRQRAAMFESLGPMVLVHGEDCGTLQNSGPDDVKYRQKQVATTRKVHKIKFGDKIDERPGTPLIPLTLPQIVSPREFPTLSPQPTSQTEKESTEKPPKDNTAKHENQRRSSMGWPFRWNIFNKPGVSQHETEEKTAADVQPTRKEQPSKEPNVVKSKVQNLLLAAKERDEAEKRRWELERQRMSRRHSRFPPADPKESAGNEEDLEPQKPLHPHLLPPLSLPPEKQAEAAHPFLTVANEAPEPITPLQHAMTEKQVLSPMSLPEGMTATDVSPRKSTPQTPVRGRSRRATHQHFVHDQERNVEQQINLSPKPSRSTSRAGGVGGAGVKVEVEVRDSPERDARERGEKIVIIRANVEDLVREE